MQRERPEIFARARGSSARPVRLYVAHLDDFALPDCNALLDSSEIAAARRMTNETARTIFVKSRAVLRHVLAAELGRPAATLRIGCDANGKPRLEDAPGIEFNLSHRDGIALIGIHDRPIGVDVERVDAHLPHAEIASHFFTARERDAVTSESRPTDRARRFFRIWTLKEAYLKGLGFGLGVDPRAYDVLDRTASRMTPSHAIQDPGWQLRHFPLAPGYVAALAVNDPGARMHLSRIRSFAPPSAEPLRPASSHLG